MSSIKKLKNELSEKERAKKQSNEILNEIQCFSQNHTCDNLNEYKDFSENQTNGNLNEVKNYPEEQKENEEHYFPKNQIYTKNNLIKNLNMEEKRIIPISKDKVGKDDLHLDNPLNKYDSDDVLKGKRNILSDRVKYKNYKISLPENQPNKRILYTSANESNHNQIENKDEFDNNLKSTVNINNGYILEPNNIMIVIKVLINYLKIILMKILKYINRVILKIISLHLRILLQPILILIIFLILLILIIIKIHFISIISNKNKFWKKNMR